MTEAEKELWRQLRTRLPLEGTCFRRQVPLGPYFVDFTCLQHRLIVEFDGGQHGSDDGRTVDARRTAYLADGGFRVFRSSNLQVFLEADAVLDTNLAAAYTGQPEPALTTVAEHGAVLAEEREP